MNNSKLLSYVGENRERLSPLLIVTHDFPDPDALASSYALMHVVERQFGIQTRIVYRGSIGRSENQEMTRLLKIPVHKLRASDFKHYSNIALVDTQPGFDNNSFPAERRATLIIDHHAGEGSPNADFALVDVGVGATSALLAGELLEGGIEIPSKLATALVYGIISDTLDFYRVTNHKTIELYLRLLRYADIGVLARIRNPLRPRKFFEDLAVGIDKARIRGPLIVSHLGFVDSPDLVSQMADFLLTCERTQWVFCTGRQRDALHMSLRTNLPDAQAARILRAICNHPREAGGQGQVAGGKIHLGGPRSLARPGTIEDSLTERLLKQLRISQRTHFDPLIPSTSLQKSRRSSIHARNY